MHEMGTLSGSVYQVQMNAKRPKSHKTISDWESKCELCRTPVNVEWKCLNCSDFMCANCYKIHRHGKLTKMHTIISKMDRGSESNLLHNIRCEKHEDENLEIFCAKCDKPVCKICLITEHNSHSLTQLETKAEEESAKIRQLLSEVSASKIKHFQEQIRNQEAAIETFIQKDKSALRDLEVKTEKIISIIREISNKLRMENANRLESMKKHKTSLTNELAQIKKSIEEAEASLQKRNALEIIQKSHYFEKKLYPKVPDVLHPVYHDFSKYRIDKEILMALKKECSAKLYDREFAELLEKNKALQQELDRVTQENEKQMKSVQSKLKAVTTRKSNLEKELRTLRDLKTQLEQERTAYRESTNANNENTEALKEQVQKLQSEIESLSEKANSSNKGQRCRDLEKENERLRSENNRLQRESGAAIFKLKNELQAAKKQPGRVELGVETNKDKGPPISAKRPQTERKTKNSNHPQSSCSRGSARKDRPKTGPDINITESA